MITPKPFPSRDSRHVGKPRAVSILRSLGLLVLYCGCSSLAGSDSAATGKVESIETSVCRLIELSARTQSLPIAFLTRLIWQESSFRPNTISPAGAQGIAQFMPKTADKRGLANPFDPEEAIPKSAELLADLKQRFGNLGLAAAAYNAGPTRVANWLAGHGTLPAETRLYVLTITRHPAEDWIGNAASETIADSTISSKLSCLQATAAIRSSEPRSVATSALFAPWGVQLAGSFSKAAALAAYIRARSRYSSIIGKSEPMIIGGRVPSRGFAPYYQVRAPAPSRAAADALCEKILHAGGACVVLRS
ncbi:MAG: lytic transglycosylase domain-containing protein [Methylocella sp.]